ncbi:MULTISPECIES: caspase family protein [unclassified Sphingomonas]|uniref:caspase family protein n=1 Tax=unclassified Sphingomonas TaxID=196159 RepID=UPI002269D731|nr:MULTISPECIES: caspase family protein [unclassified Sphingomonas]
MTNADHYALLFGISQYAESFRKLEGPAMDVAAVRKWLIDPAGGALLDDADHIFQIVSADYTVPPAAPSKEQLDAAFEWLMSKRDGGQRGWRVGQRLYLYMSGHGFSSQFKACLIAGTATDSRTIHISPSSWIEWLQDAGYFRECVLWMDACMERVALVPPNDAPADRFIGTRSAPGPTFIAMAAPRPLLALEKQLPEATDPWRGVFTYNLVEGLHGAAADQFGRVTGRSLGDWLRRTQLSWFDDADRINPSLAKMPALLQEDQALIFARGLQPPDYAVTLTLPASAGARMRLWSGHPPVPGAWLDVPAGTTLALDLQPGLYLAETDDGIRHGFAVTRPIAVALSERGPPPRMAAGPGPYQLTINPPEADPEIRLFGERWQLVDTGIGRLSSQLPYGLYEMRIQSGRQMVEKVILLDADWPQTDDNVPDMPAMTTAAPLPASRASHDYHQAAVRCGTPDLTCGSGAELFVMARRYREEGAAAGGAPPWRGVEIWTAAGTLIADLAHDGVRNEDASHDPWAACLIRLDPGHYQLRFRTDAGETIAQSLVLPPNGWRLDCYLLRATIGGASDTRPRVSLIMRRPEAAPDSAADLLSERLTVALADERPIVGEWLLEAVNGDLANPLVGIIGGHLLLLNQGAGNEYGPGLMETLVQKLRDLLGPDHPDVEALALHCGDGSIAPPQAIKGPPMYERSWRLLVAGSAQQPGLISATLWQQVQATTGTTPFFSWSEDATTRAAFAKAVAERLAPAVSTAVTMPVAIDLPFASLGAAAPDPVDHQKLADEGNATAVARAVAMGIPPSAVELTVHHTGAVEESGNSLPMGT